MGKRTRKERKAIPPKQKSIRAEGLASIIIPVFNRMELTRLCIDAIKECTPEGSYELIVIDNGSTDNTPEYLAETGAQVIRFPENRGIAFAWNAGMRKATGKYFVFLHSDALVSPGWLAALLRPFKDRQVACVSPSHTEFVLHPSFAEAASVVSRIPPRWWERRIAPFCFAVSRNAIFRVGDFDERFSFGPYAEVDFEFRVIKAGLRSVSANNALVHHFVGQTALQLPQFYGENDRKNWEYINEKWGTLPALRLSENPDFTARLEMMKSVVPPDAIPKYRSAMDPAARSSKAPRLIACVSFFNDLDLLPGCLETLGSMDEIILVDGAYADFPHKIPWSTDGSLELVKELQKDDPRIKLMECKRAWADEVEKRNAYFAGKDGDWYLVIDADERLESADETTIRDLKSFLASYPLDYLMLDIVAQPVTPTIERYGRIFRHLPGLHYEIGHSNLIADGRMLLAEAPQYGTATLYSGLRILHLKLSRSGDRVDKKAEYYRKLAITEIEALKKEIIARWNDESRKYEHSALVKMYKTQLAVLDERDVAEIALDEKYLTFNAESGIGRR